MEIEINGIKKQAAGKEAAGSGRNPEFEDLLEKTKVDKEPPFSPDIVEAMRRYYKCTDPDEEAVLLGYIKGLTLEGTQYYANLMLTPGKPKKAYELPLIALAAKLSFRSIDHSLRSGTAGEGAKEFYVFLDRLVGDKKPDSFIFDQGKVKKTPTDKPHCQESVEVEDDPKASDRLFDALAKIASGVQSLKEMQLRFAALTAHNDPDARELVETIAAGAGYYLHQLIPRNADISNGDAMLILFAARKIVEVLEHQFAGNEVLTFLSQVEEHFVDWKDIVTETPMEGTQND